MTEKQLVLAYAEKLGITKKEAKQALDSLIELIIEGTEESGKCVFGKLGTFKKVNVPAKPAREGRNPSTGKIITIPAKPARTKLTFTFSKSAKQIGAK